MASYRQLILKWQNFCRDHVYPDCPAEARHLCDFVSQQALNHAPLSTFQKFSPAINFYHDANRAPGPYAINEPFVKLMIEGAKREAAEKKPPVKKSSSLTQDEVHKILDQTIWKQGPGILDPQPDLSMWRTVTRLYTYYKTFCRFDCYQQLTTGDLAFSADHVSIEFKRAKNDQFYAGSICLLSILPGSPYCPQLVYSSYLKVMKFKEGGGDFLNCRVLKSKNLYRAKGSEKLS